MTRVYYKEAVGAFIVFDVSRVATFDAVAKWKNDLDTKVQLPDGSPIPCILLANKVCIYLFVFQLDLSQSFGVFLLVKYLYQHKCYLNIHLADPLKEKLVFLEYDMTNLLKSMF